MTPREFCRLLCGAMREIILGSNESGKKLENFLKKEFPIGYVRKLFRKNGIRLNGLRAKPADAIRAGDKIQLLHSLRRARHAYHTESGGAEARHRF